MNRKSLLILLVTAAVLGLAALLVNRPEKPADTSQAIAPGQKLLGGVDINKLAGLAVLSADGTVTLKKNPDNTWTVAERDGYTADTSRLSGLLKQLLELKIVQSQEAGPSQYPRLQLLSPADAAAGAKPDKAQTGTVVRLLDDKGATLAELVLGKAPETAGEDPAAAMMGGGGGGGKFVRLGGESSRVFLISDALYQATATPADWVEKSFFQPGAIKSVSLAGPAGFQAWDVSRDKADGAFALKNPPAGKQLASATNTSLTSLLSYAQPADILTKAERDALDKSQARVATLTTFDGLTYKLTLTQLPAPKEGEAGAGTMYALAAEVTGTYAEPAPAAGAKKPEEMTEDEKKADADAKQAARKTWDEKLAKEQALAKHAFKLNSYTIDALWKSGAEVLEDIPAPAAPAAPATPAPPAALTPEPAAPAEAPAAEAAPAAGEAPASTRCGTS